MYHVSAQGADERMINVHYYYFGMLVHSGGTPVYHRYHPKDSVGLGHSLIHIHVTIRIRLYCYSHLTENILLSCNQQFSVVPFPRSGQKRTTKKQEKRKEKKNPNFLMNPYSIFKSSSLSLSLSLSLSPLSLPPSASSLHAKLTVNVKDRKDLLHLHNGQQSVLVGLVELGKVEQLPSLAWVYQGRPLGVTQQTPASIRTTA